MNIIKSLQVLALGTCATVGMSTQAAEKAVVTTTANQTPSPDLALTPVQDPTAPFCEWLGNSLKLHKAEKDSSNFIKEFNLSLRMQYQVGWVDPHGSAVGSQAGGYQDEWRRFRLGWNAKLFNGNLKLVNIWNIGGVDGRRTNQAPVGEPQAWRHADTKASLYEAYVEYTLDPVAISLGMMKPAFTSEYRTSSSNLATVERSVLVNQLRSETNYGFQLKNANKKDDFGWLTGVYLNGVDGGARMDIPEFDSRFGAFFLGSVSYKTDGILTKKGRIWLDYVHNFSDAVDEKLSPKYSTSYRGVGAEDILVLSWDMEQDKWSFVTEIISGFNLNTESIDASKSANNVFGVVFMPSYKFTPNWEGVFRYQFATGDDGIKTEGRYLSGSTSCTRNAAKFADQLNAFYFGINYFVCAENPSLLKVMAGMEYSNYDNTKGTTTNNRGFNGWSYFLSVRTNF